MLENAVVGEAPAAGDGSVGPGMVVVVAFDGDKDDTDRLLLGSRESGTADLRATSVDSPLGAALIGAQVGESVSYALPNGSSATVEVLSAEPYSG
ncbi:MAG: transcription elongation factor GreA [Frankiales bacterium]|nr:transcription elongation factor GreA [Frankiales bacterium]